MSAVASKTLTARHQTAVLMPQKAIESRLFMKKCRNLHFFCVYTAQIFANVKYFL